MGTYDSSRNRKTYRDVDAGAARSGGSMKVRGQLPADTPIYHPPTLNPTGEPWYVDGQVIDILAEIQEGPPLRPFVEGEPIAPASARADNPGTFFMGLPLHEFNDMSASVWAAHKRRVRVQNLRPYSTIRTVNGMTFVWSWQPEQKTFHVNRRSISHAYPEVK